LTAAERARTDICQALTAIGLRTGDVALVHSDAMVAAQFPGFSDNQRLDLVIDALEMVLGTEGTLVLPTFSYSFTKNLPFEVLNTPSEVGILTEHFRTKTGVRRSADPIFSVGAKGRLAEELSSFPVGECFGQKSFFAALHRLNGHLVCLGCSLTSGGTFVHYVEKSHSVDYRYDKNFRGTVVRPDGSSTSETAVYYVRDLQRKSNANLRRLQATLGAQGALRSGVLGRVRVLGVRAQDFFATAWQMLDDDPKSLIEEGSSPVNVA
jgi:aminoglycoside 3-N-acetyltransferase